MTLKQKVLSVFELVRGLIGKRAARTELAAEFSAYEKYDVGRLVVYEDELYRCVTAHTGIWNKSDFEKATVDSALQLKGSGGGITEIPNPLELANEYGDGKASMDPDSGFTAAFTRDTGEQDYAKLTPYGVTAVHPAIRCYQNANDEATVSGSEGLSVLCSGVAIHPAEADGTYVLVSNDATLTASADEGITLKAPVATQKPSPSGDTDDIHIIDTTQAYVDDTLKTVELEASASLTTEELRLERTHVPDGETCEDSKDHVSVSASTWLELKTHVDIHTTGDASDLDATAKLSPIGGLAFKKPGYEERGDSAAKSETQATALRFERNGAYAYSEDSCFPVFDTSLSTHNRGESISFDSGEGGVGSLATEENAVQSVISATGVMFFQPDMVDNGEAQNYARSATITAARIELSRPDVASGVYVDTEWARRTTNVTAGKAEFTQPWMAYDIYLGNGKDDAPRYARRLANHQLSASGEGISLVEPIVLRTSAADPSYYDEDVSPSNGVTYYGDFVSRRREDGGDEEVPRTASLTSRKLEFATPAVHDGNVLLDAASAVLQQKSKISATTIDLTYYDASTTKGNASLSAHSLTFESHNYGSDGSDDARKISLSTDSLTLCVQDGEARVISLDTLADIVDDYVAANKDLEEIA